MLISRHVRFLSHGIAAVATALVVGAQVSAQTAPAAASPPAAAASSPAAAAAQQGLSESVLRQAQGPYRMILNQPTTVTVARPKAARVADPVGANAAGTAPGATAAAIAATAPLSAAARKAALAAAEAAETAAATSASPVTARSVPVPPDSSTAAAATALPAALTPITPAPAVVTPTVTAAAALSAAPPAPPPVAAAVAAVEKPLIAVRQEEPVLGGPLLRERPSGVVQVGFNVNADGSTSEVSVVSSTNRKLNSAVVAAVGKWLYKPLDATRRVEVAVEFKNE